MRRHDIDWLRVIAIGLLLIYHIAIGFQPWGGMVGFITNDESLTSIWPAMALLNIWRIPFLFFVSGLGVSFAIKKRNWKELLQERTKRIFFPFLFGVSVIVPIHMLAWQQHYSFDFSFLPNPSHLWFLGNLFIYVLILTPVLFLLKKYYDSNWALKIRTFITSPFGLVSITLLLIIEVLLVNPLVYEMYAMTWHGFFLGFVAFFCGYLMEYAGNDFWKMLSKWKWAFMILAIALYVIRLLYFDLKSPNWLLVIESSLWIYSVFAFGHGLLNRPSKVLTYLSQGAYPIYIVHMAFLYWGSVWIFRLDMIVEIKLMLLTVFTFGGSFLSFELIRRVFWLRPLFGLKSNRE